jgi:integrase
MKHLLTLLSGKDEANYMTQVTPIRDLKGYLEPEQVERLIAATTNPRDALLVRIPWRTGIRVSELIGIRVSDIDFENRGIIIKVQKMRKKDGKVIERRRADGSHGAFAREP